MKQTNPNLWIAGWAGAVAGSALTAIGGVGGGEIGALAGGYGLMTLGAAIYLLAGLKLRETLARRSRTPRQVVTTGASTRPVTQA
ncbi:MAG: hypothetical protein ACRDHD_04465 [Candidatus Limnocylindria bacterium]